MPAHTREDSYLDKLIQQSFSASFMSNAKWVKLITILVENSAAIKMCRVKPIWDDEPAFRQLILDNKGYDFDFYESAMEGMVSDKPSGWYAYKEIEWLDFPATIENDKFTIGTQQDLHFIKTLIDRLGQYKIELTEDNLRLYAYMRQG